MSGWSRLFTHVYVWLIETVHTCVCLVDTDCSHMSMSDWYRLFTHVCVWLIQIVHICLCLIDTDCSHMSVSGWYRLFTHVYVWLIQIVHTCTCLNTCLSLCKLFSIVADNDHYYNDQKGRNYMGKKTQTARRNPCAHWSVVTYGGIPTTDAMFPDGNKTAAKNFCRGLAGVSRPWCPVTYSNAEYCDVTSECAFELRILDIIVPSLQQQASYKCSF